MRLSNALVFRRLGVESNQEYLAYMREDCHVVISEGFSPMSPLAVSNGKGSIVATLNVIRSNILQPGEISLSESAMKALAVENGDVLMVSHHGPIKSLSYVRSKIYGNPLSEEEMDDIIQDIVKGNYSNIHMSAFITACAGGRMSLDEVRSLTFAMMRTGRQIKWDQELIADKHCIGGLPGNRTTPIVVAIASELGLHIPKTSSRAITSPAGTADTMEVITNVNLSMQEIKETVRKEGGCMAWGSEAGLSPADDILIRIEKALDLDSEGQLIASVLSKKVAAGANHVVIDIPVGDTAKVRSIVDADNLAKDFEAIGDSIGLKIKAIRTDGSQPVGNGIGPSLEAKDILSVLRNEPQAPIDLKERSILLTGGLLELTGKAESGKGSDLAREILESGRAYEKFKAICNTQGRFSEPGTAKYIHTVRSAQDGKVHAINNRMLSKLAKLAGAPDDSLAGVYIYVKINDKVKKGDSLFDIHSESEGEMDYALNYLERFGDIVNIIS